MNNEIKKNLFKRVVAVFMVVVMIFSGNIVFAVTEASAATTLSASSIVNYMNGKVT